MKRKLEVIGLVLVWFAVIAQFVLMLQNRQASITETIVRFFTILTNILVGLFFTSSVFQFRRKPFTIFSENGVLTALASFILLVGIVYQVVLRSIWQPTGLQLVVDELLHTIIPIYFLSYWYLYAKVSDVKLKSTLRWLAYPLVYFSYILVRGYFSGFYPYPFVNVPEIGFVELTINFVVVFFLKITIMAILAYIGNKKLNSNH